MANWISETHFDWTDQYGNLAEAVKLLADASWREGFNTLPEAVEEAKKTIETMRRMRELCWPAEVADGASS